MPRRVRFPYTCATGVFEMNDHKIRLLFLVNIPYGSQIVSNFPRSLGLQSTAREDTPPAEL